MHVTSDISIHAHLCPPQVLDSPFSKLTDLMMEIVEDQKLPIPKAFTKVALMAMKRSVKKRAGFELDKVCVRAYGWVVGWVGRCARAHCQHFIPLLLTALVD